MNYGMDYSGGGGGGQYGGSSFGGGNSWGGAGGNNNNDGGGGGGFGGGSSEGNSSRPRKNYNDQTMMAVTCKMLKNCVPDPDGAGGMKLQDGRDVHLVRLVAAVRTIHEQSTNIVYEVEDGTGLIQVKQWIDDNDPQVVAEMRMDACKEHIYVKVVGQMKVYDNTNMLLAQSVRRVTDPNNLTYHLLEVAYTGEKHKRGSSIVGHNMAQHHQPSASGMSGGFGGAAGVGQSMGGGGGMGVDGGNRMGQLKQMILNYIKREGESTEIGASKKECAEEMARVGNYSAEQVHEVVEELAAEGNIYSTVNEDHYKFAM